MIIQNLCVQQNKILILMGKAAVNLLQLKMIARWRRTDIQIVGIHYYTREL